jgi:hypothetical protein
MIESSRGHGHLVSRWRINCPGPRDDEDDRVPMIRKASDADAGVPQDISRFPPQRHALVAAGTGCAGPSIQSREDEGCRDSCLRDRSLTVVGLVPIASGS